MASHWSGGDCAAQASSQLWAALPARHCGVGTCDADGETLAEGDTGDGDGDTLAAGDGVADGSTGVGDGDTLTEGDGVKDGVVHGQYRTFEPPVAAAHVGPVHPAVEGRT